MTPCRNEGAAMQILLHGSRPRDPEEPGETPPIRVITEREVSHLQVTTRKQHTCPIPKKILNGYICDEQTIFKLNHRRVALLLDVFEGKAERVSRGR